VSDVVDTEGAANSYTLSTSPIPSTIPPNLSKECIPAPCATIVDQTLFPPDCNVEMMRQLTEKQAAAIRRDYPEASQVTFLGQGVQGITYRVTLANGTGMTAKVSNMAMSTYVPPSTEQEIKSRLNHKHLCRHIRSSSHNDTGRFIPPEVSARSWHSTHRYGGRYSTTISRGPRSLSRPRSIRSVNATGVPPRPQAE
jgi:hypothetical protein